MKRLILVLVLLWPVGAVAGAFFTGNEIQERCVGTKSGEPNANVMMYNGCVMYLAGTNDATHAHSSTGAKYENGKGMLGSCIPKEVSTGQLREVWLSYAKANPQNLHTSAASLVLVAFEEAWPCTR